MRENCLAPSTVSATDMTRPSRMQVPAPLPRSSGQRLEEAGALRRRRVGGEGDVLDHVADGIARCTALPPNSRRQLCDDRVEHRLRVGDRAADDAQDLGRRRLLLERLLGFVEQARVLDRDHRLVGEGLQQRDLLVAEAPVAAQDAKHADRPAVPKQRHVDAE